MQLNNVVDFIYRWNSSSATALLWRKISQAFSVTAVFLFCSLLSVNTLAAANYPAVTSDTVLDWSSMIIMLAGGLALFLFGLEQVTQSVKAVAGDKLRHMLKALTRNRFAGALTGAIVTAVIQSSSVTTVLVVGFVSAGLMTMTQSVGVIMGANVGTTITAQIVAFDVAEVSLPLIASGFAIYFLAKQDRWRSAGTLIFGLGLIFYGMQLMSEGMAPLRTYPQFVMFMAQMSNPALGILVAAVFTALVQSSSATTGLIVVMASQGLIDIDAGIAMALGANIGTCITVLLAAMGKPVEAVRAAWIHVLFNVAGVVLWIALIPLLAQISMAVSDGSVARQIANANTLFNLANTVIFIGFAGLFGRLAVYLVPDDKVIEKASATPRYLDESALSVPGIALENARLELARQGEYLVRMTDCLTPVFYGSGSFDEFELRTLADKIVRLDAAVMRYLHRISRDSLTAKEATIQQNLLLLASCLTTIRETLERDADQINVSLLSVSESPIRPGRTARALARRIQQNLLDTMAAMKALDGNAATQVVEQKRDMRRAIQREMIQHSNAMLHADKDAFSAYRQLIERIEQLRQIDGICRRIARIIVEINRASS
ncbi:Uncharacterised protein [BD1-7 clade bacterium]|uniref:PhoU domain-containing protein n=1 Tax=BD1-7 clade bacterium TaxID=2029982 RepID=A0A5S9PIT6_9GAMM|nr:Uncharacterised protein [BD1-7 clade bacterium]CAA0104106.1 Uncharacterised protein [BD1-7 clade bacterium]